MLSKAIREDLSLDILKLWISRIAFYLVLFLVVFGVSSYIIMQFGPPSYDVASARYMISALIQSEAAIMAIIVTLSLVAVEMASSSYSVRMIGLLKSYNPDFWILMVIYILSMTYSLFVLKSLPGFGNSFDTQFHISFVFHTGVYSFLILFPYLFRTLRMLRPSTLLNMQAMKLTAKSITTDVRSSATREKDPMQAIVDIISTSFLNHDFETTRNGLNIISLRAKDILTQEGLESTDRKIVANYIFSRMARFGKFTLKHNEEDATFIVIEKLELIWDELYKSDPAESILQASSSLEQIGKAAADIDQKDVLHTVVNYLYDQGQMAIYGGYDGETSRVIDSLASVGMSCVEKRTDPLIIENIVRNIGRLGIKASELDRTASVSQSMESLEALKDSMELIGTPDYQRLCKKAGDLAMSVDWN